MTFAPTGLAGAALVLFEGLPEMYQLDVPVAVQAVLVAPIALNEMVPAVVLIARGCSGPLVVTAPHRGVAEPAG